MALSVREFFGIAPRNAGPLTTEEAQKVRDLLLSSNASEKLRNAASIERSKRREEVLSRVTSIKLERDQEGRRAFEVFSKAKADLEAAEAAFQSAKTMFVQAQNAWSAASSSSERQLREAERTLKATALPDIAECQLRLRERRAQSDKYSSSIDYQTKDGRLIQLNNSADCRRYMEAILAAERETDQLHWFSDAEALEAISTMERRLDALIPKPVPAPPGVAL